MRKTSKKFTAVLLSVLALSFVFASAPAASAASFPSKPITLICPSTPGGNYDNFCRTIAANAGAYIPVPIVIKNIPGGMFTIGQREAVTAPADGYTLEGSSESANVYGTKFVDAGFGMDDVEFIVGMTAVRHTICTGADKPYKTVTELLEYAKANPGKLTMGSSSPIYECWVLALKDHGYDINLVPFPTGAACSTAVAGGHVDAGIVGLAGAKPMHEGGQLRILFIGDDMSNVNPPTQLYSEVPWLAEILVGINRGTACITGPKGMPAETIKFLENAFEQIYNDPAWQSLALRLGLDPIWFNHKDITEYMAGVDKVVGDLTSRHGVQKQSQ